MIKTDFNKGWSYKVVAGADWEAGTSMEITLPHDAMLSEPREEHNPSRNNAGYFAGNDYLYTKRFFIPEEYRNKKIIFEFEGVYRNAEVYINGQTAASHKYGYTGFYVNTDGLLDYGADNEISVLARNAEQPNNRWYSGAGIYRPVWMYISEEKYVLPSGVKIKTVGIDPPEIEIEIITSTSGVINLEISDTVNLETGYKNKNKVLITEKINSHGRACLRIKMPGAKLWAPKTPHLYTYRVAFEQDICEGTFGIRLIEWNSRKGLTINGERIILKGACIHHDNGLLGACCYPEAEKRKICLLSKVGYNAVRSAHNPCSKAMLDVCDRLGMLVLDEYADMWYIHKTAYDYADNLPDYWKQDIEDMVEKDYNHPSVIMYSTGNEVAETAQKRGIKLTGEMTEYIHSLDDTRPVTCGINIFFNLLSSMGFGVYNDKKAKKAASGGKVTVGSEFYNNLAGKFGASFMKMGATLHGCDIKTKKAYENMDIAGYNYGILRYGHDLKKYPDRLILGSETFCNDAYKFYETAKKEPRIIGDFVWAGMDYIGETGVGSWEYEDYAPKGAPRSGWLTAGSGRIDITGAFLAEANYTKVAFEHEEGPFIAVRPVYQTGRHSPSAWKMTDAIESWSWNGCSGMKAVIEVYTRADEAELYINGKLAGRKQRKNDCRIIFETTYEDGEITAVVKNKDGKKAAATLRTAEEETYLKLIPEVEIAEKNKPVYIRIQYTDIYGIKKPMEKHEVTISLKGGQLLGLGSACPYNPDGYLKNTTKTYYGEALAVVKAGNVDTVTIEAFDGKLKSECKINVKEGNTD